MKADVIIVSFNTCALLERCLQSVREHGGDCVARLIVVDNASSDGSVDMVRAEFQETSCIALHENIGFGGANNRGIEAGDAPLLLFLNSDAALRPGALEALCQCLEADSRRVIAGPRLLNPDGSFQPSCRRFPTPLRSLWTYAGMVRRFPRVLPHLHDWLPETGHSDGAVDMVSGACFLARRDYLAEIGNFDKRLFLYEEEADISLPARRLGRIVWHCPEAEVVHEGGASVAAASLGDFSLHHLFLSKYLVFRKHYGPGWARVAYWGDQALFTLSLLRNHLRGTPEEARRLRDSSRAGWRDSFCGGRKAPEPK